MYESISSFDIIPVSYTHLAINRVPLETTGNTSVSVDKNDNAEKATIFVFSRTLQPIITSEEFPLI